jgi:sporulation protein YlmC with PRC-barrel domain
MRMAIWVALCAIAALIPVRSTTAQVAGEATIGVTVEEMKLVVLGWSVKEKLLKHDVRNDKGERIGSIEDIIVSPERTASWAIIGVGGFLGLGKHDVAIPMDQLTQDGDTFILKGATREALKAMPEFEYAKP